MKADNRYSAVIRWSEEDEAFVAVALEFQGLSGVGSSRQEAMEALFQAIEMAVDEIRRAGEQAPAPAVLEQHSGQFRVRLPVALHRALADCALVSKVSLNSLVINLLAQGVAGVAHDDQPVAVRRAGNAWANTSKSDPQLRLRAQEA